MPWVKTDEHYFDNPTNRALGPAGRDLFHCCLCYSAKGLTDGRIPKADIPLVLAQAQATKRTLSLLVKHGRLTEDPDGFQIVGYLDYQPSRSQVEARRRAAADRQKRARHAASHAVTDHVTDAASHAPPVPSRPQDHRQSGDDTQQGGPRPATDDEVPAAVWTQYARLKRPPGVKNVSSYDLSTIRNAKAELGETARRWWATFDLDVSQLAAALVDGKPGPHWTRRDAA